MKVESTGFADGLGVPDERRGILDACKDLGLSTQGREGDWRSLRCQTVANPTADTSSLRKLEASELSEQGILSFMQSFLLLFFSVEKLRFGKCKGPAHTVSLAAEPRCKPKSPDPQPLSPASPNLSSPGYLYLNSELLGTKRLNREE